MYYITKYRIKRAIQNNDILKLSHIINILDNKTIGDIFNSKLFVLVIKMVNISIIIDVIYRCKISNKWMDKAIAICCEKGYLNITKLLYRHGGRASENALYLSCKNGHLDVVKYLIENCQLVPLRYHYYISSKNQHTDIVNYFENLILN